MVLPSIMSNCAFWYDPCRHCSFITPFLRSIGIEKIYTVTLSARLRTWKCSWMWGVGPRNSTYPQVSMPCQCNNYDHPVSVVWEVAGRVHNANYLFFHKLWPTLIHHDSRTNVILWRAQIGRLWPRKVRDWRAKAGDNLLQRISYVQDRPQRRGSFFWCVGHVSVRDEVFNDAEIRAAQSCRRTEAFSEHWLFKHHNSWPSRLNGETYLVFGKVSPDIRPMVQKTICKERSKEQVTATVPKNRVHVRFPIVWEPQIFN